MTNIHRYYGGHVFKLSGPDTQLLKQIQTKIGQMTDEDHRNAKLFVARCNRITNQAAESNCKLYVDAEQTYIQSAIESFA